MSKKKKIWISVLSVFLCFVCAVSLNLYFTFLHHYKGTYIENPWSETDAFSLENTVTINKSPDKDFVILNLADVQMCDLENLFNMNIIHDEITYLVNTVKPDLITLTGDQTWSNENLICLKSLIKWLDGYKIPYAPIFGNHDYGNEKNSAVASLNYCCDLYEHGKYSLFKRGPSNLGTLGNYVINIMENDKIFKTLYMMDYGYENKLTEQQLAWFSWNAEGIKSLNNGEYSDGMCFMHKPLPEYQLAYENYLVDESVAIGPVYRTYYIASKTPQPFFETAKNCGVADFVCGHQHGNSFTINYQNTRLTFALKTGELGGYFCGQYGDEFVNLNGATYFTLGATTQIQTIHVEPNQFHFNNSENAAE